MNQRNANNVQLSLYTEFTSLSTITHNNSRHALQYESGCKHKGTHTHTHIVNRNAETLRSQKTYEKCQQTINVIKARIRKK